LYIFWSDCKSTRLSLSSFLINTFKSSLLGQLLHPTHQSHKWELTLQLAPRQPSVEVMAATAAMMPGWNSIDRPTDWPIHSTNVVPYAVSNFSVMSHLPDLARQVQSVRWSLLQVNSLLTVKLISRSAARDLACVVISLTSFFDVIYCYLRADVEAVLKALFRFSVWLS